MDKENVVYIYTMKNDLAINKNEILSFSGKWVKLEDIMLSKVSQNKEK
jgi:hypothetical protein